MLKLSVEKFSRVQRYMSLSDKDSDAYKAIKERYIELKVILTTSGTGIYAALQRASGANSGTKTENTFVPEYNY